MSNEHLTRQLDILPVDVLGTPITIIGAGAVGGWTAIGLAKAGFSNLTVYDFDKVDTVNLNCQVYGPGDVGDSKTNALRKHIAKLTSGVSVNAFARPWQGEKQPGIVISAVDSMSVRRAIWEAHAGRSPMTRFVIDPRMGAQSALLYVMRPMNAHDWEAYPKTLYDDDSAVREPCTAKATGWTALLLSGLVCKAVIDCLTRLDYLRTATWDIRENDFMGHKA